MIVVECVALSIMISNDLVLPLRAAAAEPQDLCARAGDLGARLLVVRRLAILGLLALGHIYLQWANPAGLASIGLISFACIAQIAPSFFGGLLWRRGTANGAIAGMAIGGVVWFYMLFLPSLHLSNATFRSICRARAVRRRGLAARRAVRPRPAAARRRACFSACRSTFSPMWSFRCAASRRASSACRRTSSSAAPASRRPARCVLWRASVSAGELEDTVARYLGVERAREAFDSYFAMRQLPGPARRARRRQSHALCRASSRVRDRRGVVAARAVAPAAPAQRVGGGRPATRRRRIGRDPVQSRRSAICARLRAPGHHDLRPRASPRVLEPRIPRSLRPAGRCAAVGAPLDAILRSNAIRGLYGPGPIEDFVESRRTVFVNARRADPLRLRPRAASWKCARPGCRTAAS